MSSHTSAESLSAYLDDELSASEAEQVEEHLADCVTCQSRLGGMKKVVAGLRHLERMAPSSTLDHVVARRVRLDGEHTSLLDRLEGSMSVFERQSPLLGLFALVIAFAVMILLFAQALEQRRRSNLPVIFQDPEVSRPAEDSPSRDLAGRTLHLDGGIWIEEGVDATMTRIVTVGSPAWNTLVIEHPELRELEQLSGPAVIRLADETLRLEP